MADRALLLTPGASADRNQAALVEIDRALAAAGVPVERMDFGRPRARPSVLLSDVATGAAALAEAAGLPAARVALGGRSMGGRICSMAVAQGLEALALVLVSYPLHPPGRPDRPRTEHFPDVGVPCLFVSGTRDAFATPEELEYATAAIAGPVTHVWLEAGDHGLRKRDGDVAAAVAHWVTGLPGPRG